MPNRQALLLLWTGLCLALAMASAGCTAPSADSEATETSSAELAAITDGAYLTGDVWNDGQAEVAFYRVTRSQDPYGRPAEQTFTVGTYLVKHRFSRAEMAKVTDGSGVSAFKYALFYELESGSYQYKRNWVVNARQADLQPLKQSFTSFDWCSNQYREMAFPEDGPVDYRMRSDDYGNERASFEAPPDAVPAPMVPMLVRGMSFDGADERTFRVLRPDGTLVPVTARREAADTVQTPAGSHPAERIRVTYDETVPSMIGEATSGPETYWRGTGDERRLIQVEGGSGENTYRMTLVEHLRTPYWQENLWPRLERVSERP